MLDLIDSTAGIDRDPHGFGIRTGGKNHRLPAGRLTPVPDGDGTALVAAGIMRRFRVLFGGVDGGSLDAARGLQRKRRGLGEIIVYGDFQAVDVELEGAVFTVLWATRDRDPVVHPGHGVEQDCAVWCERRQVPFGGQRVHGDSGIDADTSAVVLAAGLDGDPSAGRRGPVVPDGTGGRETRARVFGLSGLECVCPPRTAGSPACQPESTLLEFRLIGSDGPMTSADAKLAFTGGTSWRRRKVKLPWLLR